MFQKFSISAGLLFIFLTDASGQRTTDDYPRAGIVNGRAIALPIPEYPPEAKEFCARGKVEIDVLIAEDGSVAEAEAISGDPLLHEVSVNAVKKAKFPTTHGTPVKIRGIIVYNFDSLAPKCIAVGIVNKKALSLPKPQVGNIIGGRHLRLTKEEIVAVQIIIDMNGKVTTARVLVGHPLLRGAAVAAARQTKFSPSFINGPPIKIRALLIYKLKPGDVETNVESDDKDVIGTPVSLVEPSPASCNCEGLGGSVQIEAKTNEQGNVAEAKAFTGHPFLRKLCEKAALESKFLPTNTKSKIFLVYHFEAVGKNSAKIKNIEIKKVELEK